MKKFLYLAALTCTMSMVACSKGGSSSPTPSANSGDIASTTSARTDGGPCPAAVVSDLEVEEQACSNSQSLNQTDTCETALMTFASKYPNIKCSAYVDGTEISICNSTNNPSLDCSSNN